MKKIDTSMILKVNFRKILQITFFLLIIPIFLGAQSSLPPDLVNAIGVPSTSSVCIDVNSVTNFIYASGGASSGQTTTIINGDTYNIVNTVTGSYAHVNPNTNLLYAGSLTSTILIYDGSTGGSLGSIPVADMAIEAYIDTSVNRIWGAAQGGGGNDRVFAINGWTNTLDTTIRSGGIMGGLAVNPITHIAYIYPSGPPKRIVPGNWVAEGVGFTGSLQAVNPLTNWMYASATDHIEIIKGDNDGTVDGTLPGTGYLALNQFRNRLYCADNLADSLRVYDIGTRKQIAVYGFPTGAHAGTIAVNTQNGLIYLIYNNVVYILRDDFEPYLLISSFVPGRNALDVPRAASIDITFNQEIDASTVSAYTVVINGSLSGGHTFTFSYNSATKTVTLDPDVLFRIGEIATVTVTRGITNLTGDSLANPGNCSFTIKAGVGSGHFQQAPAITVGSYPVSITAGDWDGVNGIDLAVANEFSNTVSILLNDGVGNFSAVGNIGVGSYPYSITSGDWNADGLPDLAVANEQSNNVSILINDGVGGYTSAQVNVGSLPTSITAGDWNVDGSIDLAVANYTSGSVSILLNDGSGSFTHYRAIGVGGSPYSITTGYWNKDGLPDLATANENTGKVSILINNGNGNFTNIADVDAGNNPYPVVAGDWNGDRATDLAVGNYTANAVTVLMNDGNGNFTANSPIAVKNLPQSLVAGDWNGNGTLDLAVVNYGSDTVSTLMNDGSGGFTQIANVRVGDHPASAIAGDWNRDGFLDLAVTNQLGGTVSVLRNAVVGAPILGEYGPDANTVLLMHMNEDLGDTVRDVSSNNNFGIAYTGATITTEGRFGNARLYDGSSNAMVRIPSSTSLTFGSGDFTAELWIKTTASTTQRLLFHNTGVQTLWDMDVSFPTATNNPSITLQGASTEATARGTFPVIDGRWHHIAGVRQSGLLKLYVDGMLCSSVDVSTLGAADANSGFFYVGGNSYNPTCTLDEIRISNIARDPSTFNLRLPPSNVVAADYNPDVYLTWVNSGGSVPHMQYKIYRGTADSSVASLALIDSVYLEYYTDITTVSGNTYCYRVSAVDSTGFESALSYAAAVTVGGLPPPVAPSNLRITGYTASVVDLTWTDNSINEDEFDIERMVGSGGTWSYYDFVSANDTTYTDNSVSQGVTYYYRVRSYNSTGGSSTPSNEVFLTIPTGDFTPPDIYDYTDISNPVVVNNGTAPTITINATPYDDSGISSFDLQYVKMGDLSPSGWTSSMNISGSTFIRNGFATGVSYRLRAVDIYNNVRITDWKAFTVRSGSPVTAQSDQPSAGGLSSDLRWQAYRIVSVPYVLDDKRPSSFLPNCLGGDHRDQDVIYSRWRFLRYTNRFLEDYDSFQNQDAVMPGLGFFLIVRDGGFHLSAGSGTVADQETFGKNSGVPVDSGWNLVGNPYCVGVPVDSMFFIREGNSAPESIMQTAYFSGGGSGGWDFTPANANSLRPWQGLAMKFAARGRLYIKAPGAPIVLPKQMAPNVIARIAAPLQQDAMNWTLPIDAERIDNALQCKGSAIGMVRDAKDGDDNYDLYMPPFIGGSNLIVYFNNQNEDMLRDIRPLNDEGSVWEMHVMTGDEGAKVRLQLPEKLNLPNSEFEAYLIDIDQKMAHNLKTTSTVEINSGNGNRTFRVVVGKRSFVEQNNAGVKLAPSEIKLYTNYPNPFNPETTIRYTIPDALTSYFVTMKIFNMLGQEIATLVNEQQTPGYYEVKWNAHGYSSGIYFYQMSVSNGSNKAFRDIKKMVLMK